MMLVTQGGLRRFPLPLGQVLELQADMDKVKEQLTVKERQLQVWRGWEIGRSRG
jgi:hypothetical protein